MTRIFPASIFLPQKRKTMRINHRNSHRYKSPHHFSGRIRCFTLLEIVAVVAIMILIGVLVLGRLGKRPARVVLNHSGQQLEQLLCHGGQMSATSGRAIELRYDPGEECLTLHFAPERLPAGMVAEKDGQEEEPLPEAQRQSPVQWRSTQAVELRFVPELLLTDVEEGKGITVAEFFPDGSVSAHKFILTFREQSLEVSVSPLTGMVRREELAEGWEDEILQESTFE